MNGYTIKSISEDGVYYLVKNWKKNKAIWVKKDKLKQEYLYKFTHTSIKSLEKLLNVMNEYAMDKFSIVFVKNEIIEEIANITIKNVSNDIWNKDYKVINCEVLEK